MHAEVQVFEPCVSITVACELKNEPSAELRGWGLSWASPESHKLLEFGKTGKGLYVLDYRYPMSLAQATACALSSFEASSLCT